MTLLVNCICIIFFSFCCFLQALCPASRLSLLFCQKSSHSRPQIENRVQVCCLDAVLTLCTVDLSPLYESLDNFLSFVLFKLCTNLNFLFCNHSFLLPLHFLLLKHFGIPAMRWLTHGPLSSCLTHWLGSRWFLPAVSQERSTNLSRCSTSSDKEKKHWCVCPVTKLSSPVLCPPAFLLDTSSIL